MTEHIVVFFMAFIISFLSVPYLKRVAIRIGAVVHADNKKRVNQNPAAVLCGVVIPISCLVAIVFSFFVHPMEPAELFGSFKAFLGYLIGGFVLIVVSVLNDIKPLPGRVKFIFYILAALCAVTSGIMIVKTSLPFLKANDVGVNPIFGYIATLLWIILMIYVFKIINYMEQFASGIASFVFIITFIFGVIMNNISVQIISIALLGANLGFLPFNTEKVFAMLGETGVVFSGYTLGVISIIGSIKIPTIISVVIPFALIGYPIIEILIYLIKRFFKVKNNSLPVTGRLYYRLSNKNYDEKQVFIILFIILMISGFSSILFIEKGFIKSFLFAVISCFVMIFGYWLKRRLEGNMDSFERISDKKKKSGK